MQNLRLMAGETDSEGFRTETMLAGGELFLFAFVFFASLTAPPCG